MFTTPMKVPGLTRVFSLKYLVSYLEHVYEAFCSVLCGCAKDMMRPGHDKIISA